MLATALVEDIEVVRGSRTGEVRDGVKGWGAYDPLPKALHGFSDRHGCTSSDACGVRGRRETRFGRGREVVLEETVGEATGEQRQWNSRGQDRRAHGKGQQQERTVESGRHGGLRGGGRRWAWACYRRRSWEEQRADKTGDRLARSSLWGQGDSRRLAAADSAQRAAMVAEAWQRRCGTGE